MNEIETKQACLALYEKPCTAQDKIEFMKSVLVAIARNACANPQGVANEAISAANAPEIKPVTETVSVATPVTASVEIEEPKPKRAFGRSKS